MPLAVLPFLEAGKVHARPEGIYVHISPERWATLDDAPCEPCEGSTQRVKVGLNEPVDYTLELEPSKMPPSSSRALAGGILDRNPDGTLLWWTTVEAPGAGGLRLAFESFSLPKGIAAYWVSDMGEAFGPYTGRGPLGNGAFWSNTLSSSLGYIVLVAETPAGEAHFFNSHFRLVTTAAMRPTFGAIMGDASAKQSQELPPCVVDGSCYGTNDFPQMVVLRQAVALIIFPRGGASYVCTGTLLNDTDSRTVIPYMLTANHCFGDQQTAAAAELVWDWRTTVCNAGYGPGADMRSAPRSLGADLLATGTATDFTFLRLTGTLPPGRWFLGWTSTPPVAGQMLYRLAHPQGVQQTWSEHRTTTDPDFTCIDRPNEDYLHTTTTVGATGSGSSGSAIVNQFGQVVGQLTGSCSEEGCVACDSSCTFYSIDGRFERTFPRIRTWLASGGGAPGNDDFVNASVLSGAAGTTTASNAGASRETGEPLHLGYTDGASVWWRWTAPAAGPVSFGTCGSSFDTVLAIYRGDTLDTLVSVAANDDSCGTQSEASFTAGAATTYYIAVQGYGGEEGTVSLSWQPGIKNPRSPIISELTPAQGVTAGGTRVIITGTNITDATAVRFGGTTAAGLTGTGPNTLECTTPAAAAGPVDVTVTTPNGTSNGLTFTYTDAPPEPNSAPLNYRIFYGNCWNRAGTIQVPGATRVRLVLEVIVIESCCDAINVSGEVIDRAGTFTTEFVEGDQLTISMTTDSTTTGEFRILSAEYEGTSTGEPALTGDFFGPGGDDCETGGICGGAKSTLDLHNELKLQFPAHATQTEVTLTPEEEIAGVPPLAETLVGKVWRLDPQAAYAAPFTVHVPLPGGMGADDNALLLYFVDAPDVMTWYRADNIAGWLVESPRVVTGDDGSPYLEIVVNHGGRLQIVEDTYAPRADAASIAPKVAPGRSAGAVLMLALVVLLITGMRVVYRRRAT